MFASDSCHIRYWGLYVCLRDLMCCVGIFLFIYFYFIYFFFGGGVFVLCFYVCLGIFCTFIVCRIINCTVHVSGCRYRGSDVRQDALHGHTASGRHAL